MGPHHKEQDSTNSRSGLAEPPGRNSVDTCDVLSRVPGHTILGLVPMESVIQTPTVHCDVLSC